MTSHWKTQKGDEWRYDRGSIQAAGDLHASEQVFVMKDISCSGGSLTGKQLMRLLRDTKQYLSGVRVLVNLDSSESEVESNLKLLQDKGRVSYRTSDSSQSQVEIACVKKRRWWSLW